MYSTGALPSSCGGTGTYPKNPGFGLPAVPWRNRLMAFFAEFLPYLMIVQRSVVLLVCSTLKNHQIWKKKLANNEENPLFYG